MFGVIKEMRAIIEYHLNTNNVKGGIPAKFNIISKISR